jgi:hypothetical protein
LSVEISMAKFILELDTDTYTPIDTEIDIDINTDIDARCGHAQTCSWT